MRVLTGKQVLVRVFLGESDKFHGQPLYMALLERLRREGFAGATVIHGIAGFGARSLLHTSQILRLSRDLPLVVEIVDAEDRMERLRGILEEMLTDGLVTMETVEVLKYGAWPGSP